MSERGTSLGDVWSERFAGFGLLATPLVILATLIAGLPPPPDAPTADVIRYFTEIRTPLLVQAVLIFLSEGLLVCFFAVLWRTLADLEGGARRSAQRALLPFSCSSRPAKSAPSCRTLSSGAERRRSRRISSASSSTPTSSPSIP